jgi:hypothetical protein
LNVLVAGFVSRSKSILGNFIEGMEDCEKPIVVGVLAGYRHRAGTPDHTGTGHNHVKLRICLG